MMAPILLPHAQNVEGEYMYLEMGGVSSFVSWPVEKRLQVQTSRIVPNTSLGVFPPSSLSAK